MWLQRVTLTALRSVRVRVMRPIRCTILDFVWRLSEKEQAIRPLPHLSPSGLMCCAYDVVDVVARDDVPRNPAEVKRDIVLHSIVSNPCTGTRLHHLAASSLITQAASKHNISLLCSLDRVYMV